MTGQQTMIFRGGGGIFYDRPDGNTVFSIPGQPADRDVRRSAERQLQNLNPGLSFLPVPGMQIFQYDAKVPTSAQWEAGIQKTLPWASVVDVSYVGNHGYNRLAAFQNGGGINLNAVDFGAAYLPQNQDLTLGPQTVPGAGRLHGQSDAGVPRARQHLSSRPPSSTTPTTRSRATSTAASATASASA